MDLPEFAMFFQPTIIIFGKGVASDFSNELSELKIARPFIVADKVIRELGLLDYVLKSLTSGGFEIAGIFDEVPQDSSTSVVVKIAKAFTETNADAFVAIGGGSVIDSAKGANIIAKMGGDLVKDYSGSGILTKHLFPLVVIPTTAGTGSEVTNAAVIYDEESKTKLEFIDRFITPDLAVLDPNMTKTLPPKVTAFSGIDALTHAIEAFVDIDATTFSDMFAKEAISIITSHLENACKNGDDLEERGWMSIRATLAGIAFSHSECGIVHGIAHALGAVNRVPHGIANAIILPYGMEYNLEARPEKFDELSKILGVYDKHLSILENGKRAIDKIKEFEERVSKVSGLPLKLRDVGVKKEDFALIKEKALQDGTVIYNPREVTGDGVLEILNKAF
ncbi:iron-containing alcohol dehydrogenase [Caldisericum sp.]|jgi:alcohol dehydrogenase class IV|uniref:iron-containing alcohol dehydrogenase n=1 Tax=Caldisericum sp. TaxID=2499687 RepID=UPI003D0B43BE